MALALTGVLSFAAYQVALFNLERGLAETFARAGLSGGLPLHDNPARWRVEERDGHRALLGHDSPVRAALFLTDTQALTATVSGEIVLWGLTTGAGARVTAGLGGGHLGGLLVGAGPTLVARSGERAWLLPLAAGAHPKELAAHTDWINSVAISPDGERLVTASSDGTARVWPVRGPRGPRALRGHRNWVWHAAFGPGNLLLTSSRDRTARIWNLADGSHVVLGGHGDDVLHGAFSPDGALAATASADGKVRLWQADGSGERALSGHTGPVRKVVFSGDGSRLLSASDDGTVRVWRVDGAGVTVLNGSGAKVVDAAFGPRGDVVAAGLADGTVAIWLPGAEPLLRPGHGGAVESVVFSPDGSLILTAGQDGAARLWRLPAGAP